MNKNILLLLCSFAWVACQDKDMQSATDNQPSIENLTDKVEGMLTIRLSNDVLGHIDNAKNELKLPTGDAELDDYLSSIGTVRLYRAFPNAGKNEYRQVEEGLNAWYTVWIDSQRKSLTRALSASKNSRVISFAEPVRMPTLDEYTVVDASFPATRATEDAPFDDPLWPGQWDLKNNGNLGNGTNAEGKQVVSSIAGADINIIPAWKTTTGSADVVVAIVDGGIDIQHEDLKDNLWVNKNEIPGNGIDDDNNGYIDDVNGYNFVDNSGVIVAHDHGTHVAGTVAARSNNGKGICGIAGGDGSSHSGARLMSCQIFKANPNYDPNDPKSRRNLGPSSYNGIAAAIVYGANNGALISQNSWGFSDYSNEPQVVKAAIDYFNKYAGRYAGALMKGGLMFFSAGNDATELPLYPAANKNVIAVAAYAPDFAATWYTNYGHWVNICAPGGTSPYQNKYPYINGQPALQILSTLPTTDGRSRYGYMQGTSMACPHLSGIAALVISKYGGSGFTREELWQRIITGIKPVDINTYNTGKYADKMGLGFTDAALSLLRPDSHITPSVPRFLPDRFQNDYASLRVAWTSDDVSNGAVFKYTLYCSRRPITIDNYNRAGTDSFDVQANYLTTPKAFERTLNKLQTGTPYYIAVRSMAANGKYSPLVIYSGSLSTLVNTAPVITPDKDLTLPIQMAGNDATEVTFKIDDKEGHTYRYEITNKGSLYVEETGQLLKIKFFAGTMPLGENKFTLTVTDQYGAVADVNIVINKVKDNPPYPKSPIKTIAIRKGEIKTIRLSDLLADENPATMVYTLKEVKNSNIKVSLSGEILNIEGLLLGQSSVSLTATDEHQQTTNVLLPVLTYMNEGIFSLFPTVTDQTLYVKLGDIINGSVRLIIRNTAGKKAKEATYHTTELDQEKRTILLDVSRLLPGKYELSIKNNDNTYTQTFIKK